MRFLSFFRNRFTSYVSKLKRQHTRKNFTPKFAETIFRNDDVGFDTNLEEFKSFCTIFHNYGLVQLHGINLYGNTSCKYLFYGRTSQYPDFNPVDLHSYEKCKKKSEPYYIGDNRQLIEYLNQIPDPLALHGLFHSDYANMTYDEQMRDIGEGLRLMKELFPKKEVDVFIAPFNSYNDDTIEVCKYFGLRLSAKEGEHLEELISLNEGPILDGQLYRYHHHRFYEESTFDYYDLSLEKLDKYLRKNLKRNRYGIRCCK